MYLTRHLMQNTEFSHHHSRLRDCRNLEQRLSDALSNLRNKAHMNDENKKGQSETANSRDRICSSRSASLQRSRELTKHLLAARAREADLQDEVDRLKTFIQSQESKLCDLDNQASELQIRFNGEQQKFRLSRSELVTKVSDLKTDLVNEAQKFKDIIAAKDKEIDCLKLKVYNPRKLVGIDCECQTTSDRFLENPRSCRLRSNSSVFSIPTVAEYFKTTISPPRRPANFFR